jgi:hypothetical protein
VFFFALLACIKLSTPRFLAIQSALTKNGYRRVYRDDDNGIMLVQEVIVHLRCSVPAVIRKNQRSEKFPFSKGMIEAGPADAGAGTDEDETKESAPGVSLEGGRFFVRDERV